MLYSGLAFIGATIVLCGIFYTYAVRSLGHRTWLLLRSVLIVPRTIAKIIKLEAQKDLDELLEESQGGDEEALQLENRAQAMLAS